MKKVWISVAAIALVLCCAIGGTLAWLSTKTASVVNTFTNGDINITLTETTGETYKMVPGNTITKDPKVTVEKGSEACWLFVKVEKSENAEFSKFMTYEIEDGWTKLDSETETGVYYREVEETDTADADAEFYVLKDNQVTVKNEVTKTMLSGLNAENYPTLKFTAYAVQRANFETAADAWNEAKGLDS